LNYAVAIWYLPDRPGSSYRPEVLSRSYGFSRPDEHSDKQHVVEPSIDRSVESTFNGRDSNQIDETFLAMSIDIFANLMKEAIPTGEVVNTMTGALIGAMTDAMTGAMTGAVNVLPTTHLNTVHTTATPQTHRSGIRQTNSMSENAHIVSTRQKDEVEKKSHAFGIREMGRMDKIEAADRVNET